MVLLTYWRPTVPHTASETSKKMHKYVMALVKIVKEQSVKIKELETKLASTEARLQDPSRGTGALWSNVVNGKKPSEQTQVLIASVNKKINEKARIENNVIISGVGVGSEGEDTEKVDKVLKALNLDRSSHVKSQRRIKSSNKGNENPPGRALDMIVVEFKNEEAKIKALREAKKLRGTELSNVYINPDKTPSERALERQLRLERNKRKDAFTNVKEGEGRHRYGVQPVGHPKAGQKFY